LAIEIYSSFQVSIANGVSRTALNFVSSFIKMSDRNLSELPQSYIWSPSWNFTRPGRPLICIPEWYCTLQNCLLSLIKNWLFLYMINKAKLYSLF
jgi:hypothetical protein